MNWALNDDELSFMASHVRPTDTFFEWGSGHTTMRMAQLCKRVVSVDHNPHWAAMMVLSCANLGYKNVTIVSCPPDLPYVEGGEDDGSAEAFASYVSAYTSSDVILVDGRARLACIDRVNAKSSSWRLNRGQPKVFVHDIDRPGLEPMLRLFRENNRVDRLALMEWK